MQLPQISCFGCSGPQPGTAVWSQAPPVQLSVVQALPSSQSAAVSQRWQSGMTESWQLPSGPQASVVQEFWSLQSAAVVQDRKSVVEGRTLELVALRIVMLEGSWWA